MCSICGGMSFDSDALKTFDLAKDRGRDYSNIFYQNGRWLANHRAIPTTEANIPEHNQPFGTDYKVVHNGTISNDVELGNTNGEIDSSVIPKVLNFETIETLRDSLAKLVGSYALGILKPNGHFYLACNYKPLFYVNAGKPNFQFSSYKEHLEHMGVPVERLKPYSVFDEESGEHLDLPREKTGKVAVICSAGLDSTVVANHAVLTYGAENVTLLHYVYGCIAETKEVECVKKIAMELNCSLNIIPIDMSFMNNHSAIFQGNSHDNISGGVEGAEYAHEWVPARNLIMMSLAVGFAEANGYDKIMLGTNLEEGGAYPDNENQFIMDFSNCLYGAVQNGKKVEIVTPVGNLMKHEIVAMGIAENAPFELTWSCYKDGDKPCGNCGPCFMRQTAFKRNGTTDPLEYAGGNE